MGGYCEIGRTPSATAPSRIVTNAMTFARTGRSMKSFANSVVGGGGYRRAALGVAYALRPAFGGRLAPAPPTVRRPGGRGPTTRGRPTAVGDAVRRTAATQGRPYDRNLSSCRDSRACAGRLGRRLFPLDPPLQHHEER